MYQSNLLEINKKLSFRLGIAFATSFFILTTAARAFLNFQHVIPGQRRSEYRTLGIVSTERTHLLMWFKTNIVHAWSRFFPGSGSGVFTTKRIYTKHASSFIHVHDFPSFFAAVSLAKGPERCNDNAQIACRFDSNRNTKSCWIFSTALLLYLFQWRWRWHL